nr:transposase (putative), gypsy type [Tanacetum cinerariifolium]
MSFSKRFDTCPVCHTRPLDSLKHQNDHFLWVDASVFPFAVPWHNNKTLRKDPHPTPTEFNADVCNYLAGNPASFRKFSKLFLCFVGIKMDLFAFIHHADPTKVRIKEREDVGAHVVNEEGADDSTTYQIEKSDHVVQDEGANIVRIEDEVPATVAERAKGSRKKRKTTGGNSGSSIPPKKLRVDHDTSGSIASTGGKSVVVLQSLLEHNTLPVKVGVTAVAALPFITSSMSLMLERGGSLVSEPPIMTAAIATTVVADTSSISAPKAGEKSVHASIFTDSTSTCTVGPDIASPSQPAGIELSADTFYVSQDKDSETLRQIYIPRWNVVNESALDDPDVCRSLVDQLALHVLFSQLRSMDYEQLFVEFNVGAARQTCLGAEVRMRLEHELRGRKNFEWKYVMHDNLLKERDVEVASLKARLSLKEAEAVEAIRLLGQIATVDSVKATQVSSLEGTCSGLRNKVMGYKLFKEQIEAVQDEQVRVLTRRRWILSRGFKLAVMKCLQSLKYRVALGGAISCAIENGIQDGLTDGIYHGKGRRGLADVAAYNPSTEANYIFITNALCAMDFPLLAQLESHKDASITDIIGLLHSEGLAAETPKASQLHPSPKQLMLLIQRNFTSRQLSLFDALVPLIEPLSAKNLVGEASAGSSTEVPSPSKIVFKKEELETTPKHTTVD